MKVKGECMLEYTKFLQHEVESPSFESLLSIVTGFLSVDVSTDDFLNADVSLLRLQVVERSDVFKEFTEAGLTIVGMMMKGEFSLKEKGKISNNK
jgi:hypothetical protein